jgi:hypothetical protein
MENKTPFRHKLLIPVNYGYASANPFQNTTLLMVIMTLHYLFL